MKQLKCTQQNPQYGKLVVNLRFLGRLIFMKFSAGSPQENQLINQLQGKGAEIERSAKGWYKINMFKDQTIVKLGEKEFDASTTPSEEIEQILFDFYYDKYLQAKFKVEEING